jgi:methylated-DNA-protein-cysteine methyltransferase-like protein
MALDPENEWDEAVWRMVAMIPAGKVASYGQIAALLGFPRRARHVGKALGRIPEDREVPWFRVINSAGKISMPMETPQWFMQRQHLEAEGVAVSDLGRISMKRYRWDGY